MVTDQTEKRSQRQKAFGHHQQASESDYGGRALRRQRRPGRQPQLEKRHRRRQDRQRAGGQYRQRHQAGGEQRKRRGADYKEAVYEGYGPGGTAIYIETLTDNVNRTVAEVRSVFTKRGGSMGNSGSVAWQFENKGVVYLPENSEAAQEVAIELGAEDMQESEAGLEISTAPGDLYAVSEGLTGQGFKVESAQLSRVPSSTVSVSGRRRPQTDGPDRSARRPRRRAKRLQQRRVAGRLRGVAPRWTVGGLEQLRSAF